MNSTQYVLLAAVIAGITQLISHLRAKDYWGTATVACAAITGGIFGAFNVESLTVVTGLAAGFGTVGAITTISKVGQTNPSVTPGAPAIQ